MVTSSVLNPLTPSPQGKPSPGGGPGTLGPARSSPVGVSLGYRSGLAGPSEMSAHSREQQLVLRQPPSAAETAAAGGPTM